jgi:hypothetical protein
MNSVRDSSCGSGVVAEDHECNDTPNYRTRNWLALIEALKRSGSLTIWLELAMTWEAAPTGKRGRQPEHNDALI